MARIRSLKPEFWSDDVMQSLSFLEQLLYMAIWNFADDAGRGRAIAKELNGFAFGQRDDVSNEMVEAALLALAAAGPLMLYEVGRTRYFQVRHWARHQVINRPSRSGIPAPCDGECLQKRSVRVQVPREAATLEPETSFIERSVNEHCTDNEHTGHGVGAWSMEHGVVSGEGGGLGEPAPLGGADAPIPNEPAPPGESAANGPMRPAPAASAARKVDDSAKALLRAFRAVRYPGKPPFSESEWQSYRQNLVGLVKDGRAPEEMATATTAAMGRWENTGMVNPRSVARHFESLLEPIASRPPPRAPAGDRSIEASLERNRRWAEEAGGGRAT